MKKDIGKRNPVSQLDISSWSASEFFEKLCEIYPKVERLAESDDDTDCQKYKELRMFQRALWIALIIEIGRLFDTFEKPDKKVISLKQTEFFRGPVMKKKIDSIFGQAIISRIIHTRKTYTAHISQDKGDVISVPEICDSNLGRLLSEINALVSEFSAHKKNEKTIQTKTP